MPLLALCTAAKNAPADKSDAYIEAAVRAADFVLALKSVAGGFTAGYEGWDEAQVKVTYKSTEHNIALIRAFAAMADALAANTEIHRLPRSLGICEGLCAFHV